MGRTILGFLLGYLAGHAGVLLVYVFMTTYGGVFDRDGGGAMGAIFVLGPMAGVVLGISGAVIAARTRKKEGN